MTNYFLIVHCEFCILNCELNLFPLRRIPLSDCSFAPATGYRSASRGVLGEVGTHGYALCSSPIAGNSCFAGFQDFTSSGVYVLGGAGRSYALPVRCVQASTGVVYRFSEHCGVCAAIRCG